MPIFQRNWVSPTIEPVSSCRRRLPVEQEGIKRAHMEESIDARLMKFPVSNKKNFFWWTKEWKIMQQHQDRPAGREPLCIILSLVSFLIPFFSKNKIIPAAYPPRPLSPSFVVIERPCVLIEVSCWTFCITWHLQKGGRGRGRLAFLESFHRLASLLRALFLTLRTVGKYGKVEKFLTRFLTLQQLLVSILKCYI